MTALHERARERELLEAALSCGRLGWRVLPLHHPDPKSPSRCSCRKPGCQSPGKHPRTKNGLTDASVDEGQILKWWDTFPLANIGIATGAASGLIVIDIDPRHGGDHSIVALEERYGKIPATVEVLTGGGGRHLYLAHPGGYIPNSSNKLAPGIDIRGDGGYVVAPPSVHVGGRDYAFEASSDPDDIPLAQVPPWLLELVKAPAARRIVQGEDGGAKIVDGGRNNALTSLAGYMRRRGFPASSILAALMDLNETQVVPPLDPVEVRTISYSVGRYSPAEPLAEVREREPGEDDDPAPSEHTRPVDWIRPGEGLGPLPMARVSLAAVLPTLHTDTRGGLPTGSVIGFEGPPDAAKTGIAQTIAFVAEQQGFVVIHLSPDNGREPAEIRYGQLMGFDRTKLELRDPQETASFRTAFEARRIYMPDPYLYDSKAAPVNTLARVIEEAERIYPGERVLLLVDSVQMVIPDSEKQLDRRHQVIATMGLLRKAASVPAGWVVVTTSQVNRDSYKNKKESKNSDPIAAGAESGSIEFGTDLLVFLTPPKDGDTKIRAEITKNKPGSGRKSKFGIRWDRERARAFEEDAAAFADETRRAATEEREQRWAEILGAVAKEPGMATTTIARRIGTRYTDLAADLEAMVDAEPPRLKRRRVGNGYRWDPLVMPQLEIA